MWKWVLSFIFLLISLLVGAVSGEYVGLWSVSRPLLNWAVTLPAVAPHVEMYRVGRGDWQEWDRRVQSLQEWEDDLKREALQLKDEWSRLDARNRELDQRERALERRQAEIDLQLAQLEEAQRQAMSLNRLREIYEAMGAQEAAQVAESLNDDTLMALLGAMEPRRAAQLLSRLEPERAARLTRAMQAGGDA